MTLEQIYYIVMIEDKGKFSGFLHVASMYFGQADQKKLWSKIRLEFYSDFGRKLPYPLIRDRDMCEAIKKWLAIKLFYKINTKTL